MRKNKKDFKELIKRPTGIQIIKKYNELDEIPNIENFKHFINCEISPDICPMTWEELEKVEEKDEKRFCKFCKNFIYRVDDEETLKKFQNKGKCLAINEKILEKLYGKWDEEIIENFQKRILISKLFLLFKTKYTKQWQNFKAKNFDYEQILKEIIKMILNNEIDFKYFIENDLDLFEVLDIIFKYIDDKNLKKEYESKKEELQMIYSLDSIEYIFGKTKN